MWGRSILEGVRDAKEEKEEEELQVNLCVTGASGG